MAFLDKNPKAINIKLNRIVYENLEKIAKSKEESVSSVVRDACKEYTKNRLDNRDHKCAIKN